MLTSHSDNPPILETLTALKELTLKTKTEDTRASLKAEDWVLLENTLTALADHNLSLEEQEVLAEVFRALRNSCAYCPENQDNILRCSLFERSILVISQIIKEWLQQESETLVVSLRCGLQFLGNLAMGNLIAQMQIWSSLQQWEGDVFRKLLISRDTKVCEYSCLLLSTCLSLAANRSHLFKTEEGVMILSTLTQLFAAKGGCAWSLCALETLMEDEEAVVACYMKLQPLSRFVILDLITEMLGATRRKTQCPFPKRSLTYLSTYFKNSVLDIVKTDSAFEPDYHQPVEIVKLLAVLCAASILPEYAVILMEDIGLLEACLDTLNTIHLLGKSGNNSFTAVQDLKSLDCLDEEVQKHPAFGVKRDLIRIIGNLCAHSSDAQNMVRAMDGIPLLMDCCNLDARNPFIMQWCILALRNLMKDNKENQSVLASMAQNGILVESSLLHELGLSAEILGDRVVIKPSPSVNSCNSNIK